MTNGECESGWKKNLNRCILLLRNTDVPLTEEQLDHIRLAEEIYNTIYDILQGSVLNNEDVSASFSDEITPHCCCRFLFSVITTWTMAVNKTKYAK